MTPVFRQVGAGFAVLALALAACTQTDDAGATGGVLGGTPETGTEQTMGAEETMGASPAVTEDDVDASPSPGSDASPGATTGDDQDATMPLGELVENADEWLGEDVEVVGSVEEQLSDDAITISPIGGAEVEESVGTVLVVRGDVDTFEVNAGQIVTVEGTFAEVTDDGLEQAGSDLTTGDEALADFDGDYVVVADDIARFSDFDDSSDESGDDSGSGDSADS